MVTHQVSGTVNLNSQAAHVPLPAMVDTSVYIRIADSEEYKEVGRAQLIAHGSAEDNTVTIDPHAVPILLRAIADAYDEALKPEVVTETPEEPANG